jgi:hypothetical protein
MGSIYEPIDVIARSSGPSIVPPELGCPISILRWADNECKHLRAPTIHRVKRIFAAIAGLALIAGLVAPAASGADYVVAPDTFLVPGQTVQGYWDDGAPVASGRVYNTKLIAMGGTLTKKRPSYRWKLLQVEGRTMPDLRIDPKTGVVYGAGPTIAPGSHRVWVSVTDAKGRTIKFWFLLELRQCNSAGSPLEGTFSPCPELSFVAYNTNRTGYVQPGKRGTEYNVALNAVGGQSPYRFLLGEGSLPPGLRLNQNLGIISGIPKKAGTFTVQWLIVDSAGNTSPVEATFVIRK